MTRVRLTFRGKLLLAQVALVVFVGAITMAMLERSLASDMRGVVESRLAEQAEGAGKWLQQNRHPEHLAQRLAAVLGARVTILDKSGTVLADSEPTASAWFLEGFLGKTFAQPEKAVEHVAVAEAKSDDGELSVRLTVSLADVDRAIAEMHTRLAVASLLGLAVAVALGLLASRQAAKPIHAMIDGASKLAKGDYALALPDTTDDELGALSRALSSLAKQLEGDMARIEQLERVRREVFANVAHELRTPITAIQGFAETLLDSQPGPEHTRKFLEAIGRQTTRLSSLVSQLLRLASLEARAPEDAVREPVDVGAIARHAALAAKARPDFGDRELSCSIDGDLVALGDPLFVEQVIDNLLDNAIRYGGRAIRLEGESSGDTVALAVVDDGAGIAEDARALVFERFFRAPGNTAPGTGLGLAIVKQLCVSMGGTVDVTSRPGETVFRVSLPRVS